MELADDPRQEPITAARLVGMLDQAGIRRAVVLSEAFWFDSPLFDLDRPQPQVRAENDWTAREVAKFPDRPRNLYFDVAEVAFMAGGSARDMETVARCIRLIGRDRILYGSDAALNGRLQPREAWALFRARVPLRDHEFRSIASNIAPYLR